MNSIGIGETYAKALFDLAETQDTLLKWDGHIQNFLTIFKNVPKLEKLLTNPHIQFDQKKAMLQKIMEKGLFLDFILLLIKKRRIGFLSKIAKHYHKQVLDAGGVVEAEITVSHPVETRFLDRIRNVLEELFQKHVYIHQKIESGILNGVIISIGNLVWNYSLKGRIETMRKKVMRKN